MDADTGWTECNPGNQETVASANTLTDAFRDNNDTTVVWSGASDARWGGISVELDYLAPTSPFRPTVDSTTYDLCNTNLGSVTLACDLRTMGGTFEEILARLAFESRTTLIPEETSTGTVWKMLTANSSYEFPVAAGAISEWAPGGFTEVGRALRDELATRFTFFHSPDWTRGDGEEAYTGIVIASKDDNDLTVPNIAALTTAEQTYGRHDAEPMAFRALFAAADVIDVAGYYAHELIRGAALFALKDVPWWAAFAVQVGDILEVTPPWASAAIKCRVIEIVKDPATELCELRLVEVE
jgi:hypothetical protein